jgi:hypothetical protein
LLSYFLADTGFSNFKLGPGLTSHQPNPLLRRFIATASHRSHFPENFVVHTRYPQGGNRMRQKFLISQDGLNKRLKISEYAAIGRKNRSAAMAVQQDEKFSLLCEETYADALILRSITNGIGALVVALRTSNLFPIGRYAVKIAESVMALYDSDQDVDVELVFDDADLLPQKEALLENA